MERDLVYACDPSEDIEVPSGRECALLRQVISTVLSSPQYLLPSLGEM
jgi:hypothetical protein